jgi:hypothetical protein
LSHGGISGAKFRTAEHWKTAATSGA